MLDLVVATDRFKMVALPAHIRFVRDMDEAVLVVVEFVSFDQVKHKQQGCMAECQDCAVEVAQNAVVVVAHIAAVDVDTAENITEDYAEQVGIQGLS